MKAGLLVGLIAGLIVQRLHDIEIDLQIGLLRTEWHVDGLQRLTGGVETVGLVNAEVAIALQLRFGDVTDKDFDLSLQARGGESPDGGFTVGEGDDGDLHLCTSPVVMTQRIVASTVDITRATVYGRVFQRIGLAVRFQHQTDIAMMVFLRYGKDGTVGGL